jgi:hypothetical protein
MAKKEEQRGQNAENVQMTEREMDVVTQDTGAILSEQPKKTVRLYQVPPGSSDAQLPDEVVQINGYTYQIKRGEDVEVPESVYNVLKDAGRI